MHAHDVLRPARRPRQQVNVHHQVAILEHGIRKRAGEGGDVSVSDFFSTLTSAAVGRTAEDVEALCQRPRRTALSGHPCRSSCQWAPRSPHASEAQRYSFGVSLLSSIAGCLGFVTMCACAVGMARAGETRARQAPAVGQAIAVPAALQLDNLLGDAPRIAVRIAPRSVLFLEDHAPSDRVAAMRVPLALDEPAATRAEPVESRMTSDEPEALLEPA